tara:strand:- start:1115 stop:1297 length:183 start_codon:yes stop_codon:yes gene_type:complete
MAKKADKKEAKEEVKEEVKEEPKKEEPKAEKQLTKVWNGVGWVTVDEDSPLYKAGKQPQG